MAHHEGDISLGEAVKGCLPLGADLADILMVLFAMRLLPGGHRVAVVYAGAHCIADAALKGVGMSEFAAPVSEYEGHGIAEQVGANGSFYPVKDSLYACGFLGLQEPGHHEAGCAEVEGEEHLPAAFASNDSVHFGDPGIRALTDECLIVLVGAPFKDAGVGDFRSVCPAWLVPDLFGEVQVVY